VELDRLIDALSEPSAYPGRVEWVEVRQTHISVAFLAGSHVYKVKKPVRLGFLDYGTLEKRRHYCEEEVRLNRRLAPEVYLGVVPVARDEGSGTLRVEGAGALVEWAVKMARLPGEATLRELLRRRAIGAGVLEELARRVAAFHDRAEGGAAIAESARFATVARNARENFEESAAQVGTTVSLAVFERLRARTEAALERHRDTIDARAARGVPRDTHGDLRLDHVYLFPGRAAPSDLVIIDAIEFNERFRHADPVADMAFLVMELEAIGRRDLATSFADAYFRASGDAEGRVLLPFYTSYRAAVRGKVEGVKAVAPEVDPAGRAQARATSRARWLLALGTLEARERRPCLLLVGGLPGSGKSTLSRALAGSAGFSLIRSDVVRKELAGVEGSSPRSPGFEHGIYTEEWTGRTYAECLLRAEEGLFEGRRVLIDASFRVEAQRRRFLDAATERGVPGALLLCQASPPEIARRLRDRREDASDADWSVYEQAAARWEPLDPLTQAQSRTIATDDGPDRTTARALDALRDFELL
jgi:aminoglycoside phosphotransferase family enzyme/predicted kinase